MRTRNTAAFLMVLSAGLAMPTASLAQADSRGQPAPRHREIKTNRPAEPQKQVARPGTTDQAGARKPGDAVKRKVKDPADTDGDGTVSEKERKAAEEKMRAERQRIRAKLDTNNDGKISANEWQVASEEWRDFDDELDRSLKSMDGRSREALLKSIDTNRDGKVDEAERAVLRERTEQARLDMLSQFDADGDGKLSGEERRALGEALRAVRAKAMTERPGAKVTGGEKDQQPKK